MSNRIVLGALVMGMMAGMAPPPAWSATDWKVTVAEGDLFAQRSDGVDWSLVEPADRLREGDRLWAAPTGRASVSGPAGLVVRLDHETQVELQSDTSLQKLRLLDGALYVKHPELGRYGYTFELELGQAVLRSDGPTIMRVRRLDEETVSIVVDKGEVRVMTASDDYWLRAGQQTEVMHNGQIDPPRPSRLATRDAFDRWNDELELERARGVDAAADAGPELSQLDGYGEWVSVATHGRAWRPRVAVGWQPYFYGQWLWVSSHGWTWVSAEPWGWLPHHYGQWVWDGFYGWVWLPGGQWAPAWVIWTPYQDGWAWAPYGPFGAPVYALHVSFQLRYWCWSSHLGGPGWWRHYHPVAAPPAVVRPPGKDHHHPPKLQPPHHRSDTSNRDAAKIERAPSRPHGRDVASLTSTAKPKTGTFSRSPGPADRPARRPDQQTTTRSTPSPRVRPPVIRNERAIERPQGARPEPGRPADTARERRPSMTPSGAIPSKPPARLQAPEVRSDARANRSPDHGAPPTGAAERPADDRSSSNRPPGFLTR